jgi:hypothetical protein
VLGAFLGSLGTYRLTLSNTDSLGGAYKLVQRVK